MKKLLLSAVFTTLSLVATAQEEAIRFGAKAGVNFASISGDETDDFKGKTGFHIGAVLEIPLSEKFAFQPELIYSTQGTKNDYSEEGYEFSTNIESTAKLNYLNIPLMAKVYVTQGFSIQAGPQIGFLLSAKEEAETTSQDITISAEQDLEDTNGIDLGVNFGLGYQLDMGLFFDGRYNIGTSNIWKTVNGVDFKQKNNVIQLSVGYKF